MTAAVGMIEGKMLTLLGKPRIITIIKSARDLLSTQERPEKWKTQSQNVREPKISLRHEVGPCGK